MNFPSTATWSWSGSILLPSRRTGWPFTETRPSKIIRSPARREATPASARNFCRRTMGIYAGRLPIETPDPEPPDRKSEIVYRISQIVNGSGVRLGFAQAGDAVAGFPLAALLEERGALETLEDIALAAQSGRRAEAAML